MGKPVDLVELIRRNLNLPKEVYLTEVKNYKLTAVIWKEGRRYVSKCPELGVSSFGTTPERAQSALTEAVELYLVNAKKLGILRDIKPALVSETRIVASLVVHAV